MTRRARGFFKLTEDDVSDENIDAIAEAIVAAILESRVSVAANAVTPHRHSGLGPRTPRSPGNRCPTPRRRQAG